MQEELALKTGYSKEDIMHIVNGGKDISLDFALSLENVLGICRTFWLNLQTNYNRKRDKL